MIKETCEELKQESVLLSVKPELTKIEAEDESEADFEMDFEEKFKKMDEQKKRRSRDDEAKKPMVIFENSSSKQEKPSSRSLDSGHHSRRHLESAPRFKNLYNTENPQGQRSKKQLGTVDKNFESARPSKKSIDSMLPPKGLVKKYENKKRKNKTNFLKVRSRTPVISSYSRRHLEKSQTRMKPTGAKDKVGKKKDFKSPVSIGTPRRSKRGAKAGGRRQPKASKSSQKEVKTASRYEKSKKEISKTPKRLGKSPNFGKVSNFFVAPQIKISVPKKEIKKIKKKKKRNQKRVPEKSKMELLQLYESNLATKHVDKGFVVFIAVC